MDLISGRHEIKISGCEHKVSHPLIFVFRYFLLRALSFGTPLDKNDDK